MIQIENFSKTYYNGTQEIFALKEVTLSISRGEFVAIVGPSGCGKSTLMNLLGCLDTCTTGKYHLEGNTVENLTDDELAHIRNNKIGFIFQSFNLLPRTTALENVLVPFLYNDSPPKDTEIAEKILKRVGLGDRMDHWPNQLSGGQQQRVAIARALVNNPAVILADEPTGALDSQSSKEIMALLQRLNREGRTIVMVTHDMEVAKHCQRIITMADGRVISDTEVKGTKQAVQELGSLGGGINEAHK